MQFLRFVVAGRDNFVLLIIVQPTPTITWAVVVRTLFWGLRDSPCLFSSQASSVEVGAKRSRIDNLEREWLPLAPCGLQLIYCLCGAGAYDGAIPKIFIISGGSGSADRRDPLQDCTRRLLLTCPATACGYIRGEGALPKDN